MAAKDYTEEQLEKIEGNIVSALMEAAAFRTSEDKRRKVSIKRGDKILFEFTIEPLNEDEWSRCRRENLKNKGKRTEELDNPRFLSQAIYLATIDEDRKRLWDNREVWRKLNVATGVDVVNQVLTPGEKSKISEVLMDIGGYNDELDDLIKNA